VGPIKYVAELVYGDQSQELLDKSVRLFILLLVFVFDPLAVMLVIAANQTLLRYGINLESTGPRPDKSIHSDSDLEYEKNTHTEHQDNNSTVVEVSGPERVVEVTKSEEVNIGTSEVLKELEKKLQQRLNKDG
jgi:ABC-type protease/lipase transport system fused ATPase/permease subunit